MKYSVEAIGEKGRIEMLTNVKASLDLPPGSLSWLPVGRSVITQGYGVFLQGMFEKDGENVPGPIYYLDEKRPLYRVADATYGPDGALQKVEARKQAVYLDTSASTLLIGMRIRCRR